MPQKKTKRRRKNYDYRKVSSRGNKSYSSCSNLSAHPLCHSDRGCRCTSRVFHHKLEESKLYVRG